MLWGLLARSLLTRRFPVATWPISQLLTLYFRLTEHLAIQKATQESQDQNAGGKCKMGRETFAFPSCADLTKLSKQSHLNAGKRKAKVLRPAPHRSTNLCKIFKGLAPGDLQHAGPHAVRVTGDETAATSSTAQLRPQVEREKQQRPGIASHLQGPGLTVKLKTWHGAQPSRQVRACWLQLGARDLFFPVQEAELWDLTDLSTTAPTLATQTQVHAMEVQTHLLMR